MDDGKRLKTVDRFHPHHHQLSIKEALVVEASRDTKPSCSDSAEGSNVGESDQRPGSAPVDSSPTIGSAIL